MFNRAQQIIKNPLNSVDEAMPQEFMKGELSGIELMMLIPSVEIEMLESNLKIKEEKDNG